MLPTIGGQAVIKNIPRNSLSAFGGTADFVFRKSICVWYIIVENKVIIELKAAEGIIKEHEAQLLNYLKATNIEVGLLLNFGNKPKFQRLIFENEFKNNKSV